MRHWYSPGAINICCGSWNVFSFSLFDEPFSFFLTVWFTTKYANADKSTCSFSRIYLQPTIYESPSSPIVTEGVERNFGPEASKLINLIVGTLHNLRKENNYHAPNGDKNY